MLKDTYTLGKEEWGIELATFRLLNECKPTQVKVDRERGEKV